ncbi:ankyrin repeat-containing domain protein [Annulohypoxylon bovei var. microspora]|nr:ankyrin repeat-containing domain protein [Annulohypoxylon bovei var. microspora]
MAGLASLPIEIHQAIANCGILSRPDLTSLALTNRRLYHAIVSLLYRHFGSSRAINFAVQHGRLDILEIAISFNLDIHYGLDSPLRQACNNGHGDVVTWLLDHGADIDPLATRKALPYQNMAAHQYSPLFRAISRGHEDIALMLLLRGAIPRFDIIARYNPFCDTALHRGARKGMTRLVEFLVFEKIISVDEKDSKGDTALHKAIGKNNLSTFTKLIDLGANIEIKDSRNMSPLAFALQHYQYDLAVALLDIGAKAEPDVPGSCQPVMVCAGTPSRVESYTVLQCEILSRLVEAGVDLNKIYSGSTPLCTAVCKGSPQQVSHMIALGADVDIKDARGYTPLDALWKIWKFSEENWNWKKVEMLVRAGAKLNPFSAWGIVSQYLSYRSYDQSPFDQFSSVMTLAHGKHNCFDELLDGLLEKHRFDHCAYLIYRGVTLKTFDNAYRVALDFINGNEVRSRCGENKHQEAIQTILALGLPMQKIGNLLAFATELGDELSAGILYSAAITL